jgi:hypothetical protein
MTRAPVVSSPVKSPSTTRNFPPRTKIPRLGTTESLVAVKSQPPRRMIGVWAARGGDADHTDGRFNFHFQPAQAVVIDAGYGLVWASTRLPDQGNDPYRFGSALIASPLTLGGPNNGWQAPHRNARAISAINSTIDNLRNTPTITVQYSPFPWLSNRLTVGGDISRTNALRLIPKTDSGSYFGADNTGHVKQTRYAFDQYTLDYLGTIKTDFFRIPNLQSDLSVGTQIISQDYEITWADGIGLASNSAYSVSAAAIVTGGDSISQQRPVGFIGQWQLGWADRLFLQLGARVDKNSGFGRNVHTFFLPKVGLSYVVSEEPFWRRAVPWASTLRLRAAYGTTGRAPVAGAADQTYAACPSIVGSTEVGGVCLLNAGNPDLRPEKGTEFEGGLDAGFFDDRFAAEVTYFRKATTDLLLQRPEPPSNGYLQNPFVNIGKVLNDGWEVALRAQLIDRRDFGWSAYLNFNTLHNELVNLGDIAPFGTAQRFAPGVPLGAFWGYKVKRVDTGANRAIVSGTMQFLGNLLPDFEGSFGTTVTLARHVQLAAMLDWRTGYKVNNQTQAFRERTASVARERVDTTALPKAERLRRFGP